VSPTWYRLPDLLVLRKQRIIEKNVVGCGGEGIGVRYGGVALAVVGNGWLWLAVAGCGWLWLAVVGCGWLWLTWCDKWLCCGCAWL
jgi:hypothetical protein